MHLLVLHLVQYNVDVNQIKFLWDFLNKKGTTFGSIVHNYAENLFLNKIFEYPKDYILNEFGFDPIWNEFLIAKKHVDQFHKDTKNKLIPIRSEFVVYDKPSLIAGMMDMLFYNVKAKEFQIWDWKTNKKFSMESNKRLINSLYLLQESDLEIYSLQLEMYKQILERNTSIKLGDSYIVWFSKNNDNYKIIKTKDRKFQVNTIINERIAEIAA